MERPHANLVALAEFTPVRIPSGPPGRLELAISILNATSAPAVARALAGFMRLDERRMKLSNKPYSVSSKTKRYKRQA